jgi:hypothetical protein
MRHAIEFQADQLSEIQFGAMLRRLAEDVAHSEDHDLVVVGHRAGGEFTAHAVPAPLGSYVTERPGPEPQRNDMVAALWRYYVSTDAT